MCGGHATGKPLIACGGELRHTKSHSPRQDGYAIPAQHAYCGCTQARYTGAEFDEAYCLLRVMSRLLLAWIALVASVAALAEAPLPSSAIASSGIEAGLPLADNVIVRKSERRLYLMRNGQVLRSYRVALGLRPDGHKQFEGDYRTPEGKYRLVRRNPNSEFFLSIQVSYPNDQDIARARAQGHRPGGAIMIHGQPNVPRKSRDYYTNVDWTEGCIALANSDMVEIWLMTPPDTPIEIQP